jgi:hypothetical protein
MAAQGAAPQPGQSPLPPKRVGPEQLAPGVFAYRGFLPPLVMLKVLAALDRLAPSWAPSEALGLLGRGGTSQVRPTNLVVQTQLDEIRLALAPAAERWARSCGFRLPKAPYLALFPVKMVGDAKSPAHQEPHTDSSAGQAGPPVCTNVFYVTARSVEGGALAVATADGDLSDPLTVHPTPNTIISFAGDRVHWVEPLYAGERLSVVINFY